MKIFKALAPLVVLALLFTGCPNAISKSDAKNIVSLKFEAAKNTGLSADVDATFDGTTSTWSASLKGTMDVTKLVATFELSPKATASVGGTAQTSGSTANNFSSAVTYTVTAEDGSTADYKVAITAVPYSSNKDITSFSLAYNGKTYAGSINESATPNPTIEVFIPETVANKTLVASFTLSSAATVTVNSTAQTSGTSSQDFAATIDYVVKAEDLTTKTYSVSLTAAAETLMFSEYFEGTSNNKYLEIYNSGASSVDLSKYCIDLWSNGAAPAVGVTKKLSGTLAAGKTVVYHHSSATVSPCDTLLATTGTPPVPVISTTESDPNGWKVSVTDTTGNITYFNGNDSLVLKHCQTPVDTLGYLVDQDFGTDLKLVRKPGYSANATFTPAEWRSIKILGDTTDDNTVAAHDFVAAGATITEFVLGGVRCAISGLNITVTLPSPVTALAASFMTSAASVTVNGVEQVSNVTANSYVSPVSYVVTTGGTTQTYTVTVTVLDPANYVLLDATNNYNFDGGLQAARTTIGTNTTAVNLFSGTDTFVTLTGVVTSMPTTSKFYIQDQNVGLLFYKTGAYSGVTMNVGDKVTVTARKGVYYKGSNNTSGYLYEITDFDAPQVVEHGTTVYYVEANATTGWANVEDNRVYRIANASFAVTADRAQTGKLNGNAGMVTRCPTSTITFLPAVGEVKTFHGVIERYDTNVASPVTTYQMILYAADQIR